MLYGILLLILEVHGSHIRETRCCYKLGFGKERQGERVPRGLMCGPSGSGTHRHRVGDDIVNCKSRFELSMSFLSVILICYKIKYC